MTERIGGYPASDRMPDQVLPPSEAVTVPKPKEDEEHPPPHLIVLDIDGNPVKIPVMEFEVEQHLNTGTEQASITVDAVFAVSCFQFMRGDIRYTIPFYKGRANLQIKQEY